MPWRPETGRQRRDDGSEFVLTTITIVKTLHPNEGELIYVEADDGSQNDPPLVDCLGMIRLAEDSIIRHYMNDEPDETG